MIASLHPLRLFLLVPGFQVFFGPNHWIRMGARERFGSTTTMSGKTLIDHYALAQRFTKLRSFSRSLFSTAVAFVSRS